MTCALAGSDHLQRCAAALGGPTIVRKGAVDGICDGEAALECGAAGSKRRAGGQARPLGLFWPAVSLCARMRPLDTGHVVCQLHNLEVHSLPRTAKRRRVEANPGLSPGYFSTCASAALRTRRAMSCLAASRRSCRGR